ncbi:hypothetical protein VOLCADRAFT_90893 [Volvox carteri f. nagariensis]|uniref:Uncharacterized protein n=1 Tax=Volvox carteri f. nagariensis TaxID=3068 RepID=D8TVC4_VOLCA|nr:uncharacterized protein VOLCADRAFT_90893 [Volvox carteri f. nagariensis]EFJ48554.1 hypothetical protein VOLCADRAFT_90893 [Volvox carteri f. nagariensis]|eukprot:XP_002950353.1 hypothetical protein VOLCADRAFT_90893 [Volvox carteri f. nagariensis]
MLKAMSTLLLELLLWLLLDLMLLLVFFFTLLVLFAMFFILSLTAGQLSTPNLVLMLMPFPARTVPSPYWRSCQRRGRALPWRAGVAIVADPEADASSSIPTPAPAAYPGGPGAYPAVPPAVPYGAPIPPGMTPQGQPYTPQQEPPYRPPAVGIPVLGSGASYLYQHPVWGSDDDTRDGRFACCGWSMFVLGFIAPFFWLISVLLPCCLPGSQVQRAATASLIAAILYAVLAITLAPALTVRNA